MPIAVPAFLSPLPGWMCGPAPALWPPGASPLPGLAAAMPAAGVMPRWARGPGFAPTAGPGGGLIRLGRWQDRSEPTGLAGPEPVRAALQRFLLAPWKPAVPSAVLAEAQRSMIAPDRPWTAGVP